MGESCSKCTTCAGEDKNTFDDTAIRKSLTMPTDGAYKSHGNSKLVS